MALVQVFAYRGKVLGLWSGRQEGGLPCYSPCRVNLRATTPATLTAAATWTCFSPDGLSVDVEDYYHVEAFADRIRPEDWINYPSRVADNTRRVLDFFAEIGAKATFFVLGHVAEGFPTLVRDILAAGHEVGCHSSRHRRITTLTPDQFRDDTRRALAAIQDAGGREVLGYRAPTFSIVKQSLWAIPILAEEGFLYDSSVYPVVHDKYGMPEAPRHVFRWEFEGGSLFEIPPLTVSLLGRTLPVGGGGYLRNLPIWYTRWAIRRIREHERRPVLVYLHPWEMDPLQPRLEGSWKSRLRHYRNLELMEERLREVIQGGRFRPLKEVLQAHRDAGAIPSHRMT